MLRKVIPAMLVILILLVSANSVMAADDTLDIEKVAIAAVKNSLNVQSMDSQVKLAQKNAADMKTGANSALTGMYYYGSSSQLISVYILTPIEADNMMTLFYNAQPVTVNAVRYGSYSAYIGLLKVNYALNIQKSLVDSLAADYKKAQQELSLGMITQNQLRLIEISYLKAQYGYSNAQKSFNSVSMAINNLMGVDINKQYASLQDYNIFPAEQIKSLDDYIKLALANRAEILNDQSTLETKKKELLYNQYQPQISIDLNLYRQQLQYAIDNTQNNLDLDKINVQLDITNHYKSLQNAMNNLEAMKDLDDQAAISYQAALTQYNTSQITLNDLDYAKIAKAQADMNYKNAQLDAWFQQTTMNMACSLGYQPSSSLLSGLSSGSSTHVNKQDPATKKHMGDQ